MRLCMDMRYNIHRYVFFLNLTVFFTLTAILLFFRQRLSQTPDQILYLVVVICLAMTLKVVAFR